MRIKRMKKIGQKIPDPQMNIPALEKWLYKNPDARAKLAIGLQESSEGKVTKVNLDDL
jgi:hypothetical protein